MAGEFQNSQDGFSMRGEGEAGGRAPEETSPWDEGIGEGEDGREDDLRVAVDVGEDLARTFEPAAAAALRQGVGLKAIGRAAEEAAVRAALSIARGKRPEAAGLLQVSSRALRLRLQAEVEAQRRAGSRERERNLA